MCQCCENHESKRFVSLNPFKDVRSWKRVLFKEDMGSPSRESASLETDHDLQKDIQNLLCDVHEEALAPFTGNDNEALQLEALKKIIGVNKRLASLLTVSALETGKLTAMVCWLTILTSVFGIASFVTSVLALSK